MDLKSLKGYQFGPFRLDLGKGYLYREDGLEVELKPTSKSILEYMLENTLDEGGTLFKRGQIFDAVWGSEAVEDGALDKQIAELRKAFGRGERDQSVIETKPREGYRFKLPATKIYAEARSESTTEVALEQQRPVADTFGLWLFSRRGLIILLPLALLVGATIAASIFYRECPTRAQTIASVGQCGIILLPFVHSLRNKPKGLLSKQSPAEVTNAGYSVDEFVTEQPILQKRLQLFTNWWSAMLVSWVPQGLPATLTALMTVAAKRMAARNVLVKELTAVESLGAITLLATDKTGTLTRNQMTVGHVWTCLNMYTTSYNVQENPVVPPFGNDLPGSQEMIDISALCSRVQFDSTDVPFDERALLGDATDIEWARFTTQNVEDYDQLIASHPKVFEVPFLKRSGHSVSTAKHIPMATWRSTSRAHPSAFGDCVLPS